MKALTSIFVGVLAATGYVGAYAQDTFPNKPIKLIVPFPAGGALDSLARPIALGLGKRLGQNVVVENKPGGNLIPASIAVASAPADGYTLYYTLGQPYSTNQFFYKSLPYDVNAYTPIAPIGVYTYTFQAGANTPFKTLKEVIEHAKKKEPHKAHQRKPRGHVRRPSGFGAFHEWCRDEDDAGALSRRRRAGACCGQRAGGLYAQRSQLVERVHAKRADQDFRNQLRQKAKRLPRCTNTCRSRLPRNSNPECICRPCRSKGHS